MRVECDGILTGNAKDHADYRFRVGKLRGLEMARDLFKEALSTVNKIDDDE